jgi:hypothetical protein
VLYDRMQRARNEQLHRFPKKVAKSLRRAIYYSDFNKRPEFALKYYKQALEQCDELGLDFFSDQVVGIKLRMAKWLVEIHSMKSAIRVLEELLGEMKRWQTVMESAVRTDQPQQPGLNGEEVRRQLWVKRNKILGKATAISVKLGELYADDHVLQPDKAHRHLVWAVETTLQEIRRRAVDGLKEGEGPWMSREEVGATLEGNNPFEPPPLVDGAMRPPYCGQGWLEPPLDAAPC